MKAESAGKMLNSPFKILTRLPTAASGERIHADRVCGPKGSKHRAKRLKRGNLTEKLKVAAGTKECRRQEGLAAFPGDRDFQTGPAAQQQLATGGGCGRKFLEQEGEGGRRRTENRTEEDRR